jgi:hypothetical protein
MKIVEFESEFLEDYIWSTLLVENKTNSISPHFQYDELDSINKMFKHLLKATSKNYTKIRQHL